MNKKLKKLVSGTSVTLCALIAFSLPTQVFAQNLPINTEVKTQTPNEEQSSDEYKTGNILSEIKTREMNIQSSSVWMTALQWL